MRADPVCWTFEYPPAIAAKFFVSIALATVLPVAPALAGPTETILSATPAESAAGEPVTFTARVYGSAPSGPVTFRDDGSDLGTDDVGLLGAGPSLGVGGSHNCALTGVGALLCWGRNNYGQIGDGTTTDRLSPVPVGGIPGRVVAVVGGGTYTCALSEAGAAYCWGYNSYGQLGDGTTTDRLVPTAVSGLSSSVVSLSAGISHTCAVMEDASVRCWGRNSNGELGDGTTEDRYEPVAVSGLTDGVVRVAAGSRHTCAVTEAGAALCWGDNNSFQLGDGTDTDRLEPTPVSGLSSGVTAIDAASYHSCAVTAGGALQCWGLNDFAVLGNGGFSNQFTPGPVSALTSGGVDVALGIDYSCALMDTGIPYCWGWNFQGELGDGSVSGQVVPVPVFGITDAVALSTIAIHSCILTSTGAAKCWGQGMGGALGDGSTDDSNVPVDVIDFGAGTAMIPGEATFATDTLAPGQHEMTAYYGGDSVNDASTSPVLAYVVRSGGVTTMTIDIRPKKPKAGASARLRIRVKAAPPAAGKPEGVVFVRDGGKALGRFKVRNGKAGVRLHHLRAGLHVFSAVFKGRDQWERSVATRTVWVRGHSWHGRHNDFAIRTRDR